MDHRYCLEVYAEEDWSTPAASLFSDSPYLTISAGDVINRATIDNWTGEHDGLLEVVRLEHIILHQINGLLITVHNVRQGQ